MKRVATITVELDDDTDMVNVTTSADIDGIRAAVAAGEMIPLDHMLLLAAWDRVGVVLEQLQALDQAMVVESGTTPNVVH